MTRMHARVVAASRCWRTHHTSCLAALKRSILDCIEEALNAVLAQSPVCPSRQAHHHPCLPPAASQPAPAPHTRAPPAPLPGTNVDQGAWTAVMIFILAVACIHLVQVLGDGPWHGVMSGERTACRMASMGHAWCMLYQLMQTPTSTSSGSRNPSTTAMPAC